MLLMSARGLVIFGGDETLGGDQTAGPLSDTGGDVTAAGGGEMYLSVASGDSPMDCWTGIELTEFCGDSVGGDVSDAVVGDWTSGEVTDVDFTVLDWTDLMDG